jgi:hypothetical protein
MRAKRRPDGGSRRSALPRLQRRARTCGAAPRRVAPWPPAIKPVFAHALSGEGVWKRTRPLVAGRPPVLVTTFRAELAYPRILAYLAWFDHRRTALAFYPGRYEPPTAPVRGPMSVPYTQRWRLLAAFNGGFTHIDGLGNAVRVRRTGIGIDRRGNLIYAAPTPRR